MSYDSQREKKDRAVFATVFLTTAVCSIEMKTELLVL